MVDEAEKILGYRFRNADLLTSALTHASSADSRLDSNERMEFLGDAILGYVVCEHLYQQYPDLLEGELTKIKSAVVSRTVCAQITDELGLAELLNLGKGMAGGRQLPQSVQAAALEAVIAGVYLDGGLEAARTFILDKFAGMIERFAASTHQQNFKSVLQHHVQKAGAGVPQYVLLDEKGPDHAKCFEVCVELAGRRYSSAWAKSKKEAEQQAALLALQEMQVAQVDDDGHVQIVEQPVSGE